MIHWIADRVEVSPFENKLWWTGVITVVIGVFWSPTIVSIGMGLAGVAGVSAILRKYRANRAGPQR